MTDRTDELKIEERIVLVTDICSSSEVMEDLLRTGNIANWRNLLINFKEQLATLSQQLHFNLYKFTGDGWIILFDSDYNGREIIEFISDLSMKFEAEFKESIFGYLENPPDITGLTFGMDYGLLVHIEMMERQEYVGRAINLACRLQGAITETDILTGYRAIISNRLFRSMENNLDGFHPELIKRKLKNIIRGGEFQCCRLSISNIPFKINKAVYGTERNSVDVTQELISLIKGNCIDTIVINEYLGGDPDPGQPKRLHVEYVNNNEDLEKDVSERARIQLP